MTAVSSLAEMILPHLKDYGSLISAAGIRYGSVAYIAFGEPKEELHSGRASTLEYPVELEIGADDWALVQGDIRILDSNFENVDEARIANGRALLGKKLQDISLSGNESVLKFSERLELWSQLTSSPSSGFLYSFQGAGGGGWETVDGKALSA
jgi:hypothetical protein